MTTTLPVAAEPRPDAPAAAPSARSRARRGILTGVWGRVVGPLLVLAVWWAVTAFSNVPPIILPSPGAVVAAFADLVGDGTLLESLLTSLGRAMTGLAIGIVVGVALALITGLNRVGDALISTNMHMLQAMPILALQPLVIVWFGIGEPTKILLVALAVVFPIYINTYAAIRSVDIRYVELAETLGLSRRQLIARVVLPGALPGFLTGLRFATAISWLILVVAEQVNAISGIGYMMTQARTVARTDIIIVGLFIYALLGLLSDLFVRALERKALVWAPTLRVR